MATKATTKKASSTRSSSGKTTKKTAKKADALGSKLRIKVSAYEHKVLDASVKQIVDTALRYEAKVQGPTPLPVEKKTYTVNRGPFVHEDAREQFQMRVHKRLIDILNPGAKIIESITNIELPAGVGIEIKML